LISALYGGERSATLLVPIG